MKDIEAIEFIDRITPKNWIPCLDDNKLIDLFKNGFKKKSSDLSASLYIRFFIINEKNDDDNKRPGECHGPMRFYNGFSSCEMWIYPHKGYEKDEITWQGTVIHELAHIAVDRLMAYRIKAHKGSTSLVNSIVYLDENPHGPTFQKALRRMLNRAFQVYGNELDEVYMEIEFDLDQYEWFSDE